MSTVSVVMATYNGHKYICEQLESIRTQTRTPDEVLIYDDISTDDTVAIVRQYIKKHSLENKWHVVENIKKLGCDRNFIEAAKASGGDVIFFSDQDDVWYSDKIEKMTDVLDSHDKAMGVTCLSDYIDSDGGRIKKLSEKFTTNLKSPLVKYSLTEQIRYNRSAGLEIAFRREIVSDLEELVIRYDVKHDQPVGMIASLKGEYYGVNEKLLAHRIHTDNLSAPRISIISRIRSVKDQIEGNYEHLKHMEAFMDFYRESIEPEERELLAKSIASTKKWITAMKERSLIQGWVLLKEKNPMINSWIRLNNILCIIAGSYNREV